MAGAENLRIDVVLVLDVDVFPNNKSCGLSFAGGGGAGRDMPRRIYLALSTALVLFIFIGVIAGAEDKARVRVAPGGIAFDNDASHLDEYVWLEREQPINKRRAVVVRCRGLPANM